MDNLILNLKKDIIKQLNLEEVEVDEIETDAPLFGEGLGLDSIDALELIVMLEKKYNKIIKDPEKGKEIFYSVRTIADYIEN